MKHAIAATLVIAASWGWHPAVADEIAVFSTPSLKPVLEHLGPRFEAASGHRLQIKYAAVAALKREIDGGAPFDVVLLLPDAISALIESGEVARGSAVDLAVALVGVAVRKGSSTPDIGSADALKQSLLAANSVAYAADSASGKYFLSLIERLGIGPEMQPKLRVVGGSPVEAVERGDADLTVITVPNILGASEVVLAGVLPSEFQNPTTFTAGVTAKAGTSTKGHALVEFLSSPDASSAFAAHGLQQPAR